MTRNFFVLLCALAFGLIPISGYAHEGHNDTGALTEGVTAPTDAPLVLSAATISNLDIKTAPAVLSPLPQTLSMPATVTLIPDKQAQITTRFDGQIHDIKVNLGQDVQKGQDLIDVEPVRTINQIITLKSPISGRVIAQNVVLGQSVTFQTPMIEIADVSKVLLRGAIYESPDLAKLEVGQKVKATIGIYPGRIFEGTVEKIDAGPAADSRALHVYALLDNPDGDLKPNLRGTMTVELDGGDKPTIAVPVSAVIENNGVSFLFVREGEQFERREVQIGRKSGSNIEIVRGLFPDEQVVTQGNYQLQYLKPESHAKPEH